MRYSLDSKSKLFSKDHRSEQQLTAALRGLARAKFDKRYALKDYRMSRPNENLCVLLWIVLGAKTLQPHR